MSTVEATEDRDSSIRGEEDARALAAKLVHAIYRLIKGSFLHESSNQAIAQLVESVMDASSRYCERAGVENAAILFAANSVFVNRQMLRAARETYQLALELGNLLQPCHVTELTVGSSLSKEEVTEFGRAVADAHREKKLSRRFADGGWETLKVRKVVGFGGGEVLPAVTRVARTYAASILIVRAFYNDLRASKYELPHGLKRIAHKLVSVPGDEARLLISTAATPSSDVDRAGIIVASSIVAVAMAQNLTDDRAALTSLGMAALLYDAGRERLARGLAIEGQTIERTLNEAEEEALATSSIVTMTALGKLHPPALSRSVILYEALSLRNASTPAYGGRRSIGTLARVLAMARAFIELRVARGASAALSVDDAIQVLGAQARDNTERTLVKLLIGTLGIFPAGTLVELNSGELAVVVATPLLPVDFARPPVRVLYDKSGLLLDDPIDLDLASPDNRGSDTRYIKKPIDATEQQMKQMRTYVVSLATKRAQPQPEAPASTKRPANSIPRRRLSGPMAAIPSTSASDLVAQIIPVTEESTSVVPAADDDAPVISFEPFVPAPPLAVSVPTPSIPRPERANVFDSQREPRRPELESKPNPRNYAKRRDPRSEEEAPQTETPQTEARQTETPQTETAQTETPQIEEIDLSIDEPAPEFQPRSLPAAAISAISTPLARSTREVNWANYGKAVIDSRPPDPLAQTAESPAGETDQLLAEYLAEIGEATEAERVSAGLRWDRSSQGAQQMRPSAGLRWNDPSAAEPPPSEPKPKGTKPRDAATEEGASGSSGGIRWNAASTGSGGLRWGERRLTDQEPDDKPDEDSEGDAEGPKSLRNRQKAGSTGWGNPKRGKPKG
jgi:hypothetical protein